MTDTVDVLRRDADATTSGPAAILWRQAAAELEQLRHRDDVLRLIAIQSDPAWGRELAREAVGVAAEPSAKPIRNPHEGWPTMMFCEPLTGASRWFAWYPIRTWDHRWRWLCWVERRLIHGKPHLDHRGFNIPVWQYRLVWRKP